jgi:hypothetical protein
MDAFQHNLQKEEFHDACEQVIELLDELDAVEVLRAHLPPSRSFLMDRLEIALRRMEGLNRELEQSESRPNLAVRRFK